MLQAQIGKTVLRFGLIVVDMQNGFVSKGGSYNKLGMNIKNYRRIIPQIQNLINFCRKESIPIFYTQAVREPSGIDLLLNDHRVLPRTREERLEKIPICVRGTWDADITEIRVWLRSQGIKTLIFCGVDTSICVETSLRDGFNLGYDAILIADATASGMKKHYDTTLERVRDYYGIVTHLHEFKEMIKILERINNGELEYKISDERISEFLEKHKLIDISKAKL
jgi:ureidoacrylate peracid hydrolase